MNDKIILTGSFLLLLPFGICNKGTGSFQPNKRKLETVDPEIPVLTSPGTNHTVATAVGQTIYLYCGVQYLGDRQVSWIRSRDLHILTVGLVRYTRDQRFTAIHGHGNSDWALKIVDPQLDDMGLYECQISYHDDKEMKLKMPFFLQVLESRARILGQHASGLYLKEGSEVSLSCLVENSAGPPAYVYWYKGGRVINYDQRRGINVRLGVNRNNQTVSTLVIESTLPSDSGNYTCSPANAIQDSLILNVIKGEKQAGLQEISSSSSLSFQRTFPFLIVIVIIMAAI